MTEAARTDARHSAAQYFELVTDGVLRPDDRIELLEGVIVAMSPQNPRHASGTYRADLALKEALGHRAVVRVQLPLVLGTHSVPEPDVAVVPGRVEDYDAAHPTSADLIVEVADSSLPQDRVTKVEIYAAAGIPEYWLVDLAGDCIEVYRSPDSSSRRYLDRRIAQRGERLDLIRFDGVEIAVDDLLPTSGAV